MADKKETPLAAAEVERRFKAIAKAVLAKRPKPVKRKTGRKKLR